MFLRPSGHLTHKKKIRREPVLFSHTKHKTHLRFTQNPKPNIIFTNSGLQFSAFLFQFDQQESFMKGGSGSCKCWVRSGVPDLKSWCLSPCFVSRYFCPRYHHPSFFFLFFQPIDAFISYVNQ